MRVRFGVQGNHQRTARLALSMAVALLLAIPAAHAGQINVGDPQVDGETITVPVLLQAGGSGDVSSLDFRVRYDPNQLKPVRAMPGPSAQNADKDVIGNERNPGEFSVVMMGLNRNVVGDGEVANITFERVGGGNAADVRITQTTLASPDAVEIPSRGSSRTISFDGSGTPPAEQEDPAQQQQQQQQESAGQSPGTDASNQGQTQTAQAGTDSPSASEPAGSAPAFRPNGSAPDQQVAQGSAPAASSAPAGQQGAQGQQATPGTPRDASEVQGQLQDAIAGADAARSGVSTPAGTPTAQAGGQTGSAGQPAQGAAATDEGAQGQTVDAPVQVAQVRSPAEAGQTPSQRADSSPAPATAAEVPQGGSPVLPLVVAGLVAMGAVAGLFVVRKKLFA